MMSRLTVDRLGARGEGVAQGPEGLIYVPYALAGETIAAEIDGSRGTLVEVLAPSPSRIAPFCRYFSRCGGCAVQTLAADSYARWKRDLVASALRRAGLAITVADLADAHGAGRRRATFHARYVQGRPTTGFMKARAHDIVEIDSCPLLAASMDGALPAARAIARALAASGAPLDILVTATASGLDVDLKGHGRRCHAAQDLRFRWRFGSQGDEENQLSRLPLSARDHPPGDLALSPVHTELP